VNSCLQASFKNESLFTLSQVLFVSCKNSKSHHPVIRTHITVNRIQVWTVVVVLLLIFAIHNIAVV